MQNVNKSLHESLQAKYPHLEIAILSLSQVQKDNEYFRIDSEPFKKSNLSLNSSIEYIKLSQIATINPSKTELQNYDENSKVTFLSMQNLGNGFINEREKGTIKDLKSGYTYFAENDILVAKITPCMEHGKCAIATNLTNKVGFGSTEFNVFRVKDSRFLQEFIFCYLNRENIRKIATDNMVGTSGRQRVPTAFYENLPIPILPKDFQLEIQNLVQDSHKALEDSKVLYKEAERLLYESLGLDSNNSLESLQESSLRGFEKAEAIQNKNIDCHENSLRSFSRNDDSGRIAHKYPHLNLSIRSLSQSYGISGRLDSEYYQTKYDAIERKIRGYQGGYCKLQDIGFFTNGSFIPENLYTQKAKRAYIRIKELSFNAPIRIQECIYIDDNFEATNETMVKQNDFVIATIGNTIGKINLIPKELSGSFISNNTSRFRLTDESIIPEFLELLLRNFVVQEQIQREFTQTAQPKISNTSLENILIPKINSATQEQIALKIQKSFSLRKKSKDLLESAKIKVENAIEQFCSN